MRAVFRLMGMPDKVIAVDGLPEAMLKDFEMINAEGFPRHWKQWLGKSKKITISQPEKDHMTGKVFRPDPIVEEDSYFYLVDYRLNPIVEKWEKVCDYIKQYVKEDFRLREKIDDMALPLAPNKTDGVNLEPEDVVVIPLKEKVELILPSKNEPSEIFKCEDCPSEFDKKQGLRMHRLKRHPKPEVVVTEASV